ncbi:hypothetical protein imdm_1599 [gamma proteobacterium IMCC2047]|nr:hypothetical protein imdm_1599 [gamma proteobacterium IMCC2047]
MPDANICPLCRKSTDSIEHITEQWLLEEIRKEHPEWVEENGLCTKCIAYYRNLDNVFEFDE